ncbi:186_t:CDS:2 [Ambispora leptoticha]|uniref:186_t:CDS:1 n=1 Tax=Ambispora leptoticha TaxID=144679 RepID=A0A9N9GPN8_9GLOM|nr:186_t:CDS:2 [Ambispora leptoticha]
MVNENLVNLINKKPIELVQELKDYEIKKSPLSPAARAKVINKSGSGYVSENKEGYGPCTSSNCKCSVEELQRQYWQNQLREQERVRNRTFKIKLKVLGSYYFYTDKEYIKNKVSISNIDEAREFCRDLEYGNIYISYEGHSFLHHDPQPDSERTNRTIGYLNDEFKDISLEKYSKERDLVEKIVSSLLPQQDVKIRFVDNHKETVEELGYVIKGKGDNRCVSFVIEPIIEKEKTNPGFFCDIIAHELAHASKEVFENPQHVPHSEKFFVGVGHDKIWHDKYGEFQEKIKNENLAVNSGYIATGKETKGAVDIPVYIHKARRSEFSEFRNKELASIQTGGFSANVGYDGGSSVSFGAGGVEAKVAGVGKTLTGGANSNPNKPEIMACEDCKPQLMTPAGYDPNAKATCQCGKTSKPA